MSEQASNVIAGQESASDRRARPVSLQEAELVRQVQAGQTEAFAGLVEAYQDRVINLMYRLCGRVEDAEELAQEAFCKAFEKIGQFRHGSRFYTWLFRIATNLALSKRRRGRKVTFVSMNASGSDDPGGEPGQAESARLAERRDPGPEANAQAAETADRIQQALSDLDEEFRAVVVLRDIEDMDYAEIADVLDMPVGTVKSRIHRGRLLLRQALTDLVE